MVISLRNFIKKLPLGPGEWMTAVGSTATFISFLAPTSAAWVRPFGLGVLLAGVVIALREIRERHQSLDERLNGVALAAQLALQYGSAISLISEAISEAEKNPQDIPHIRAVSRTLQQYALTIIPERARGLHALLSQRQFLTLLEYHFLNDFLRKLVEELPQGSSWFGITHLTEGWLKETAEPGYRDFAETMQERCEARDLRVLRIYCYQKDKDLEALHAHLAQEKEKHLVVRTLSLSEFFPPDLSLIWPVVPSLTDPAPFENSLEPVRFFTDRKIEPVSALEFTAGAGRLLREFKIYVPRSPQVLFLQQQFAEAWRKAIPWT